MPLKPVLLAGVQRAIALCRGLGELASGKIKSPKTLFLLFARRRRRREQRKEVFGDTPSPGRENPAPHVLRTFSKVRDDS